MHIAMRSLQYRDLGSLQNQGPRRCAGYAHAVGRSQRFADIRQGFKDWLLMGRAPGRGVRPSTASRGAHRRGGRPVFREPSENRAAGDNPAARRRVRRGTPGTRLVRVGRCHGLGNDYLRRSRGGARRRDERLQFRVAKELLEVLDAPPFGQPRPGACGLGEEAEQQYRTAGLTGPPGAPGRRRRSCGSRRRRRRTAVTGSSTGPRERPRSGPRRTPGAGQAART